MNKNMIKNTMATAVAVVLIALASATAQAEEMPVSTYTYSYTAEEQMMLEKWYGGCQGITFGGKTAEENLAAANGGVR